MRFQRVTVTAKARDQYKKKENFGLKKFWIKFLKVSGIVCLSLAVIFGIIALLNKISEGSMNKYIDSFAKVEYDGQVEAPMIDGHGNYYFTDDGDFKVMHLTDIHIVGSVFKRGADKKALNAVAAMVSEERPDLVVITGDISFAVPYLGTVNNAYAHRYFIRLMERLGVYWTVTFGNHDSEKYNFHKRADVAKMYSDAKLEYCLFSSGPDDVFGECNHVINLKNGDGFVTRSFIMIDSNAYTENDPFGLGWDYDIVRESQINWYLDTVKLYQNENAKLAEPDGNAPEHKSLIFMHIPMREVKVANDEYVVAGNTDTVNVKHLGGVAGESGQVVYCPENEEMLFETICELGSTDGVFFGHDHLNNFVLEYKGVIFSYGHSVDYSAYAGIAKQGAQRGCSLIFCRAGGITVTHENYYQEKYQPLYEKERVDISK